MSRLALISVALILLWGCESGSSNGPAAIAFTPAPALAGQGFAALYAPPVDVGPYPSNIYNPVAAGTGLTLAVPAKMTSPLAAALNTLDGFSTTATITAPFNAPLDAATLIPFDIAAPTGTETIYVLDATNGVPLRPGVDYDVQINTAAGADGSVLEITPIRPLATQTTYAFILTGGIENAFGVSAWSMTTQSIADVLATIENTATARTSVIVPTGFTTAAVSPSLPGVADIYVGYLEIPYYGDPQDALGSVWVNSSFVPPTAANPVQALRIPLIATLPNAGSMRNKPMNG